jgi:hypothetical protein
MRTLIQILCFTTFLVTASAQAPWVEVQPNTPLTGSRFGRSLDIDGSWMVVGASFHQGPLPPANPVTEGRVYVFHRVGGIWLEDAVLTAPDSHLGDGFGWKVVLDTGRLFVGGIANNAQGERAGKVYQFERSAGQWQLTHEILGSDTEAGDHFGASLAVDGDRLVVGAPLEGFGHLLDWGKVYIFDFGQGAWSQSDSFAPVGTDRNDWVGYTVALEGDRALVGSYADDTPTVDSGSAWIYKLGPNGWEASAQLIPNDPEPYAHFSVSLMLKGARAFVGAHRAGQSGVSDEGRGVIYVFEETSQGWVQTERLAPGFLNNGAILGLDMALAADGSLWSGAAGYDQGRGAALQWSDATYLPRGTFVHEGLPVMSGLGIAVAVDGDLVALGAPVIGQAGPGQSGRVFLLDPQLGDRRRVLCDEQDLLWIDGSLNLSQDDLTLYAHGLPANQFGFIFYGGYSAPIPLQAGDLCVSGPRFRLPGFLTGATGDLFQTVDLSTAPAGFGPGQLQAGSTWSFQAWVREPASPNGSRFSAALELRFAP